MAACQDTAGLTGRIDANRGHSSRNRQRNYKSAIHKQTGEWGSYRARYRGGTHEVSFELNLWSATATQLNIATPTSHLKYRNVRDAESVTSCPIGRWEAQIRNLQNDLTLASRSRGDLLMRLQRSEAFAPCQAVTLRTAELFQEAGAVQQASTLASLPVSSMH